MRSDTQWFLNFLREGFREQMFHIWEVNFKESVDLRMVSMKIWNKENVFRNGYLFEYKDDISFKKCLPIWQEIEALEEKDISIKYQSIRGIVTEDILF